MKLDSTLTQRSAWRGPGTALLLLCILALVLALTLLCNSLTPVLNLGDRLPQDISGRIYAVDLSPIRRGEQSAVLTFRGGKPQEELSLLVSGTTPFSAYSGDELLYRYGAAGKIQRLHVIPLEGAWKGEGLEISFDIENSLRRADILLGESQAIKQVASASGSISMLLLGMLLMMMLYSITLYMAKRSEQYLAILAEMTAVTTLVFLNDMSFSMLHLPLWLSELIRNLSQIGPGYLFTMAAISLWGVRLPPRLGFLGRRGVQYGSLALVCALSLLTSRWSLLEPLFRIVLVGFTLFVLWAAGLRRERGALLLLAGYAAFQGMGACFDIVKHLQLATGGTLPVLVRLPQLGNVIFLCCATVKINFRFADKFLETERLAGELEQLNRSLDSKVEQRTHQLAQQQEEKHRLMLNIFHDLRSPIFVVKGCLRKLRKNPEDLGGQLELLADRVDFMDHLTEDLFTIAKLEEGDLLLVMDLTDFSALCAKQCGAAALAAAEKGILLCSSLKPGVSVWGDQLRLEQALQNLLTNAITYTPQGGRIDVEMNVEGEECSLSVRDTGRGISREDMPHIFSRYYRVDRAVNSKSTGLGLSIAHEIVQLHKGRLTVESEEGKGTVFQLTLPVLG